LDSGEVARCNVEGPVVVADKQVEDHVARLPCHSFNDLIGDWWDAGVANGDHVKGLEVMNKSKGTALLLYAEPAGAVQGVGMLVYTCREFFSENFDDVL
jgi:hypothetical protein